MTGHAISEHIHSIAVIPNYNCTNLQKGPIATKHYSYLVLKGNEICLCSAHTGRE